jgi:uncharacterized protein
MAFSLYDATVPAWLQMLGSVSGKAEAHCAQHGLAPAELIEARLADDMLPLGYQVKSTVVHSAGAIRSLGQGVFSPDRQPWPDSFAGLRELVAAAREELAALDPATVEAFVGRDMRFEIGSRYRLDFTAEHFLMSFSLPNFYFHATTAYDILRARGLAIGKVDFLGQMRTRA